MQETNPNPRVRKRLKGPKLHRNHKDVVVDKRRHLSLPKNPRLRDPKLRRMAAVAVDSVEAGATTVEEDRTETKKETMVAKRDPSVKREVKTPTHGSLSSIMKLNARNTT